MGDLDDPTSSIRVNDVEDLVWGIDGQLCPQSPVDGLAVRGRIYLAYMDAVQMERLGSIGSGELRSDDLHLRR